MTLASTITQAFAARFGAAPTFVARAPGRVNLIGEHTDYNEGFVLPMAIDRAAWLALRPRSDRHVCVHSLDFDQTVTFALADLHRDGAGWAEYLKGVAWALQEAGLPLAGWEGVMAGDVPVGAGLSSSAAVELATARAFAAVSGLTWDAAAMARLCQRAENAWVGVNCGIMDQLISAAGVAGHALLIDCRSLAVQPVPLPAGAEVVVLYSAAPRTLASSAYNQRRAECEAAVARLQTLYPGITALRDVTPAMLAAGAAWLRPTELRRARHIVSENERVLASAAAMQQGDLAGLGAAMTASHASLRDDYAVSSRELDLLVALALAQPGVWGARLTGAGFGGCAIALAAAGQGEAAAAAVMASYRAQTGLPGQGFVTRASAGAALI